MFLLVLCTFVLAFGPLPSVRAQIASFGSCKNVQLQANFQPTQYLGRWYEYAKYPFAFEFASKCNIADYASLGETTIQVNNSEISTITGDPVRISGKAEYLGDAKFIVTFFDAIPSFSSNPNYNVVSTDYTNYAVVYSCKSLFGLISGEVVWILTRERFPSTAIIDTAKGIISANGISLRPLKVTDHNNCPENN